MITIPAEVTNLLWGLVAIIITGIGLTVRAKFVEWAKIADSNAKVQIALQEDLVVVKKRNEDTESRQREYIQAQAERAAQLSDQLAEVLTELKNTNDAKAILGERVAKVETTNEALQKQVEADQKLSSDQQKEIGALGGQLAEIKGVASSMSQTNSELRIEKDTEKLAKEAAIKAHAETQRTLETERADWAVRESVMSKKIEELSRRVIDQQSLIEQMSHRLDYLERKIPFKEFIERTDPDPDNIPPSVVLNIKAEQTP